jgi:hypothetical protein
MSGFTIVEGKMTYAVVHTSSHKVVIAGLNKPAAQIALDAMGAFDAGGNPSEARINTWRGACKRAIARAEVKA